jgi:hypothetical protein
MKALSTARRHLGRFLLRPNNYSGVRTSSQAYRTLADDSAFEYPDSRLSARPGRPKAFRDTGTAWACDMGHSLPARGPRALHVEKIGFVSQMRTPKPADVWPLGSSFSSAITHGARFQSVQQVAPLLGARGRPRFGLRPATPARAFREQRRL